MLQVKIFKFRINNRVCSDVLDDARMSWYQKEYNELMTIEEIENEVNEFLATHQVVNMDTEISIARNNEDKSRDNNVDIIYTFVYETNIPAKKNVVEKVNYDKFGYEQKEVENDISQQVEQYRPNEHIYTSNMCPTQQNTQHNGHLFSMKERTSQSSYFDNGEYNGN